MTNPPENDENIIVNRAPSVIVPEVDADGNWHMKKRIPKFGGTTHGPGRGPNGHEDFAD
jgi:hypothetical protein